MCFVLQMWESDEAIEEDMSESPDTEKHDKEKEQRNSKKARGVCVCVCVSTILKLCSKTYWAVL